MVAIKSSSITSLLILISTVLSLHITRAPVHAQGFQLLYSDLMALDTSVNDLTAATVAYNSGNASPILAQVSHVNATNRKAYYDAMSDGVAVQNLDDSNTIVSYVSDPIAVDITNGVAALNDKKAPLVAAGYRQQVLDGLNLLVGDHETLSAAIAKKLDPLTLAAAAVPVAEIDLAVRSAIANFEL